MGISRRDRYYKKTGEYMMKKNKSQMILIYAALIAFVAVTLIVIAPYIARRVQGLYQQAGDAIGEGEQKGR